MALRRELLAIAEQCVTDLERAHEALAPSLSRAEWRRLNASLQEIRRAYQRMKADAALDTTDLSEYEGKKLR